MTAYNRRALRYKKAFAGLVMRRVQSRAHECFWCKRALNKKRGYGSLSPTRDHVKPKSVGGRKTVPCCRACNELKGSLMPAEWRRFMQQNPRWWELWKPHDHSHHRQTVSRRPEVNAAVAAALS